MSKYKIHNQKGLYFLTLTTVGWVDVFTRAIYRNILVDSLNYCIKEKGLVVYAYVIMSNHIHLIAQSVSETQTLSDIIRDFKSFTAKEIRKKLEDVKTGESRREWLTYLFGYFARGNQRNRTFQFWQSDNHPIELWSPKVIEQKLAYIHWNPVNAKIVAEPSHYIYSSASNYFLDKGILEVQVIPPLSEIGYIKL